MKIRTDFVTNSSSSSFVAVLDLTMDNGESLRFVSSASRGGEEGGFPIIPEAHYNVRKSDLDGSILWKTCTEGVQKLQRMLEIIIDHIDSFSSQSGGYRVSKSEVRHLFANEEGTFFRNANEIVSGVLKIQVHTYGEYFNDADPKELLRSCSIFGMPEYDESDGFDGVCAAIRQESELTERSVADLARVALASWDEHGHDTQITQTLSKGKIDIRVETGEGIIPVEDTWESIRNDKKRRKENAQYDFKSRMKVYGLDKVNYLARARKLAEEYDALSLQDQAIDWSGKVFCFIGYIGDLDYYYYFSKYDKEAMEYTKCSNAEAFNSGVDYVVLGFKSLKAADEHEASVIYDFFDRHYEKLMAHLLECKEHHIRVLFNDQFRQEVDHLKQKDNARLYSDLYVSDTLISIEKKHYVFTDLRWDENWVVDWVKKYGGIVHDNAVKVADYCVVGSQKDFWFGYSPKVKQMLGWKHKGSNVRFIPIETLVSVFNDDQTREENERLAAIESRKDEEAKAEEKRNQAEEARKQQEEARRLRTEDKQRKAELAHAQQEEARRIRDEEKRRQAELAKQKKERLAEEEKAMRERQRAEALANATILYAPGEEPEKLRKRLDTLFEKLDGAYPDKKISRLNQDHKKWGETVTELYRLLGYPDGQAFLEAYGYTVVQNAGGRKASVDPVAIMEELHRRYPDGGAESIDALMHDNPDIPWKTLANNARAFFGNTLAAYLKEISILRGRSDRAGNGGDGVWLSQNHAETEDEPLDNAGDASVIAQSEVKNSSPSDTEPQQPTALEQHELAEKAQEDRAYYGDHSLNRVIIPEGCKRIGNGTFGMSSLTDIQIPASVRSIGSMAFCGLLKIGAITIPEGVRELGNMVFSGSVSLKTVVLPASLESVGKDIFYGCESLERVTMPQVTFDCFKNEAWLKSIESVIEIESLTESDTGGTASMGTTDENDEDSWIQAIAAETPLQDEEILYLRIIHQLFQSADTVRMIDVAKRLEQGTGKVSYWMKKLREKGILDTTSKGVITMLKP